MADKKSELIVFDAKKKMGVQKKIASEKTTFVRYSNDLNTYDLSDLSVIQRRFLMLCLSKAIDKGDTEVVLTKQDIKENTNIRNYTAEEFDGVMTDFASKIFGLAIFSADKSGYTAVHITRTVTWEVEKQQLRFTLDSEGLPFCNNLNGGKFTMFEIKEFSSIRDEMGQQLYQIMKQWRVTGRTGLINPVAVFDPVELEGTTVERASVHNLSMIESLKLGIGDEITVYKANMIIPQIAENLTKSGNLEIPEVCPACGGPTAVMNDNGTRTLVCPNKDCSAKMIKSFTLFVSRDAMQIDGMSEATLEKFIARGMIREYADIYKLEKYKDEICDMEGFGEKSYDNLHESIEKSRNTTLVRVIYSLGILNVGLSNAKVLCRFFDHDLDRIRNAKVEELSAIEGIGDVIAKSIVNYFSDPVKAKAVDNLIECLHIEKPETSENAAKLAGKTFVITGSLNNYSSRGELKDIIEQMGGKVAGSVSSNTTCLINNDVTSQSSKNKKAKELGVAIISEDDFIKEYLE